MRRLTIQDIPTAVEIYHLHPELGTSEIKKLFGCSSSSATRLKAEVRKQQKEKGILSHSDTLVNTKLAFEVWGFNISELEKHLLRYQKIQKGMTT